MSPRKKTNEAEPVEQVLENPEANFAVEDRPITNSEANSVQGPFDYSYFPSEQKVEEPALSKDEYESWDYSYADIQNTRTRWEVSLSIVRWLAVTGTVVYAIHHGFFEFLYSVIR